MPKTTLTVFGVFAQVVNLLYNWENHFFLFLFLLKTMKVTMIPMKCWI